MQVPASAAIMQVLMFCCNYCNYAGGTFRDTYAGGSFGCSYAGDSSVTIMQLEVSATLMPVKICASNMWVTIFTEIMQVGVMQVLQSCKWYFLHCIMHMTISILIMQVSVSFVAMYVTASSSKFIFLSLTDIHFSKN